MATSIKKKLLILPPIILGIIIIIFMVASKKPPEQRPFVEPAHKVRVIKAAAISVVPRVLGYGSVAPQKVWNAVAEVAGRII